jgi:tetratricopeptide (TPR) repeat protein
MLKNRIILLLVSAALIWLIFLLPKVVVENEDEMRAQSDSAAVASSHTAAPAEVVDAIRTLRRQFLADPENEKNSIFADSLRSLYSRSGKFDSAAWFAGQVAVKFNTPESYLKAGNSYFDAFTFEMDATRQVELAETSRMWLEKVLEADPGNMQVKNKVAMTFMATGPPMTGIGMLRDIVKSDPKNQEALYNLGMFSVQSGQHGRAIDWLKKLLEVNPKHVQGHLLLGVAHMSRGDKEEARQQFEMVKRLDQDPAVIAVVDSYMKDLE